LEALITIWIAAIGLSIGSFLNVVIARLPKDESVVRPRSRCPKCGHQLPWYENVPVISWLALRGKCSGCKAPISPRYIMVELLTGTLFVAASARFGFDWPLVSALTFFTFVIPLIFIDAEYWILPFELTLPALVAGLVLAVPQGKEAFLIALIGAIAAFLAFRLMEVMGWLVTSRVRVAADGTKRRVGRETLGMGDKFLLAVVGTQVGWRGLLGVILFSSLQGSIVGLARMRLTGRAGPESAPKEEKQEETTGDPDEDLYHPFTAEFLQPGLSWWRRLLAVPYTIFLQDIPDSPPPDETTGEIPDWEPQANNIPFGPWIGLAGIEVMLLGPWIVERLAHTPWRLMSEIVFGR
jgi:leader peptidase (prepilin peptidase)/N-methyltransferase